MESIHTRKIRGLPLLSFVLAVILISSISAPAKAEWPERPIRFIVPVAAGGGVDLMARVLVDRLNQQLPQRVVIENIGGGGGAIGARDVAKADPDGYTFLFAAPGFAAVPATHEPSPYDPIADFAPVSLVTEFPLVAVIRPDIPAQTLPDFIALLKKSPDKFNYGSSGVGGSSHMPVELFDYLAGVKMVHVPFRGNAESSAAMLAGQVDFIIDGLSPQLGNIAEKRVRVLGVTTRTRTPFLPDIPAIGEILPGYEYPMWVAVFAPAKTPPAIVDRMSKAIAEAVHNPATQKRYEDIQATPIGSTPAELDTYFRRQLKFNADIAQRANIHLAN
ncbi:MAG TPA: tripartite tricarboxylate transporter substrate-binding protein [Xanthobacteraceae bacterium]|jgi:tripartite-type tricarboxylate transporter receptor subunit TctC|nr:tripartite tricarboxylate transporter substrate-binding protein [Xanthobacteraceae bacterium]